MKKSIMSVSTLVVLISMVAMLLCGSVANAQTGSRYVYDKKENHEVVYNLDASGKYLTPKLKYEFTANEEGVVTAKTAYRWSKSEESWKPYYQITISQSNGDAILEYAAWNSKTGDFSYNMQKAVYNNSVNNDPVTYLSYNWNSISGDWDLTDQIIFQNYLAIY